MIFNTPEDYKRYQMNNTFRFFSNGEVDKCAYHNRKAVGEWINREEGFTEYTPSCKKCLTKAERHILTTAGEIFAGGNTDEGYCECCKEYVPKFQLVEQGIEENFHVYKDPETREHTDMCLSCLKQRKAKDAAYYAEEMEQEQPRYFPEEGDDYEEPEDITDDEFSWIEEAKAEVEARKAEMETEIEALLHMEEEEHKKMVEEKEAMAYFKTPQP